MTTKAMERGFKLILGSQSMARKRILAEMGYDYTIVTADIDEKAIRTEKPEDLVVALAEAKVHNNTLGFCNLDSMSFQFMMMVIVLTRQMRLYRNWEVRASLQKILNQLF
jgi:hypothetical protein